MWWRFKRSLGALRIFALTNVSAIPAGTETKRICGHIFGFNFSKRPLILPGPQHTRRSGWASSLYQQSSRHTSSRYICIDSKSMGGLNSLLLRGHLDVSGTWWWVRSCERRADTKACAHMTKTMRAREGLEGVVDRGNCCVSM